MTAEPSNSLPLRPRLIVGLGNPGRQYAGTRHNVGFDIVDLLTASGQASWSLEKRWETDLLRGADFIALKPRTFMNLSGKSVGAVAHFFKIAPEEILVVHDDVDLPLGHLRLRPKGSAGGHNGVKSIIEHLGSQNFPRLKVGIGSAEGGKAMTGHVLGKFSAEESKLMEKTLEDAAAAIRYALAHGLEPAMNRFNQKTRTGKPPKQTEAQQKETESIPGDE